MKNFLMNLFVPLVSSVLQPSNPDLFKSTTEIIQRHGYPVESHPVETEDGYILTLHRIPYSRTNTNARNLQPVFIQHGLLMDSSHWVLNGLKSLPFVLSDAGFDVWLGNARGNKYSNKHKYLSTLPISQQYWNFSWHEMGVYDVPAVLKYISDTTQKPGEIIYIGHSMGSTMFFIYESIFQNVSKYVKIMIGLAPAAFQTNVRSTLATFADYVHFLEILNEMGFYEFLPFDDALRYMEYKKCTINNQTLEICKNIYFSLMGPDREQLTNDVYINILSHDFSGTSFKTFLHYFQEIHNGGDFRRYDYGKTKNLGYYGQETPPLYNLTAIKIPIHIMSGLNDYLTGPTDINKLVNTLPSSTNYVIPIYNHMDFLFARDSRTLCYDKLLEIIRTYN